MSIEIYPLEHLELEVKIIYFTSRITVCFRQNCKAKLEFQFLHTTFSRTSLLAPEIIQINLKAKPPFLCPRITEASLHTKGEMQNCDYQKTSMALPNLIPGMDINTLNQFTFVKYDAGKHSNPPNLG
jgi:hypothetical protein